MMYTQRRRMQGGARHGRHVAAAGLLHCLCWTSERFGTGSGAHGLRRTYVLGGPLRGCTLAMPNLWRPSFALGTYQRHVMAAMRRLVRPGMVAYDVGASVGYFTLLLAQLVGETGAVYAFEPEPHSRRALAWNVEVNRRANTTVVPSAVAAGSGEATFATFPYASVSHLAVAETPPDALLIPVPVTSLDDFVYRDGNPPPSFIKIDVEGAEEDVFAGATRLLDEVHPIAIAEIWDGPAWHRLSGSLAQRGYRWTALNPGVAAPSAKGPADLLFLPPRNKPLHGSGADRHDY